MTVGRPYQPIDFRKPRNGLPAVSRPHSKWLERVGVLAGEGWNKHLASPVTWDFDRNESMTFAEAAARIPDPGIGFAIRIEDASFSTFWAMSQVHALALVSDMLGHVEEQWPEPRSLTSIEESLVHLLMNELAWAIGEAWPGRTSLTCCVGDIERRPARSRLFGPQEKVLLSRCVVKGRLGEAECFWILPEGPLSQMLAAEWPESPNSTELQPAEFPIERFAGSLPITLTVCLGTAQLPMAHLADLQVGDVIVLDQFIGEPIAGELHGTMKFRGFPGRIGRQRAFQISEALNAIEEESQA